ncbi:MAG TPA: hypothetical protein VN833_30940 [Candidatus Acidoferrales bacterium]|jgi:prophage maintenance system killer protein|nr:hypothetical protein [Candidatus Acidoferrales bacterium]
MQLLCDTPSRECDVVLFLELNGYRFNANEEDAAQVFLELASGNLDEAGPIAFLHTHASLGKK